MRVLMAEAVQDNVGWSLIGAAIGAVIAGFFAWLVQRSRGESAESIAVLEQWEKLNGALSDRLAAVEKEFAEYRQQIAREFETLRTQHANEIDEMRKKHRTEMRGLRDLNEGLQRMISQQSQSAAHLLGETPVTGTLKRAYGDGDEGGGK